MNRENAITGIFIIAGILLVICIFTSRVHSTDNIKVENKQITLLIDYPTIGVSEIGKWSWPNLDNALADLYDQFHGFRAFFLRFAAFFPDNNMYTTYDICLCIRTPVTDKYGNQSYQYSGTYKIASVVGEELEKYVDVSFLDSDLSISKTAKDIVDRQMSAA